MPYKSYYNSERVVLIRLLLFRLVRNCDSEAILTIIVITLWL